MNKATMSASPRALRVRRACRLVILISMPGLLLSATMWEQIGLVGAVLFGVSLASFFTAALVQISTSMFGLMRFSLGWMVMSIFGFGACLSLIVALEGTWKMVGIVALPVHGIFMVDRYLRTYLSIEEKKLVRELKIKDMPNEE